MSVKFPLPQNGNREKIKVCVCVWGEIVDKKIFFTVKILTHIHVHACTYVIRRLELFYVFFLPLGKLYKDE